MSCDTFFDNMSSPARKLPAVGLKKNAVSSSRKHKVLGGKQLIDLSSVDPSVVSGFPSSASPSLNHNYKFAGAFSFVDLNKAASGRKRQQHGNDSQKQQYFADNMPAGRRYTTNSSEYNRSDSDSKPKKLFFSNAKSPFAGKDNRFNYQNESSSSDNDFFAQNNNSKNTDSRNTDFRSRHHSTGGKKGFMKNSSVSPVVNNMMAQADMRLRTSSSATQLETTIESKDLPWPKREQQSSAALSRDAVYSKSHRVMSDIELDSRQNRFFADTLHNAGEAWPEPDDLAPPPDEWLLDSKCVMKYHCHSDLGPLLASNLVDPMGSA